MWPLRLKKEASQQRNIAEVQEKKAITAKQAEEYEAYIAQIGLANAKINDNAYDYALELLNASKPELRNWEWGRLTHLCELGAANYKAGGPVNAVAYSPDGRVDRLRRFEWQGYRSRCANRRRSLRSTARAVCARGRLLAGWPADRHRQQRQDDSDFGRREGQMVRTLKGHTDGVLTVRFSPDGRHLISGSYDNTARLWDVATGSELQAFKGHSWWVWAAEFSPDGNEIVTAGQDGKAIVWQKQPLQAGGQVAAVAPMFKQVTEFTGHDGAIYSAKFSPDGKLVATGGYDKMVMVWNPADVHPVDIAGRLDGKPDAKPNYVRLAGHNGPVRSVAFSPKGKLILSGSEDNSIRIWDLATGESVKSLRGHGSSVRSCTFSPDGEMVLSGGDDESVRLWNVRGYEEVRVLHATVFAGHEDAVLSARFLRDGQNIVTASRDRTASLWDAATGQPVRRFQEGHEFLVSGACSIRMENIWRPARATIRFGFGI